MRAGERRPPDMDENSECYFFFAGFLAAFLGVLQAI